MVTPLSRSTLRTVRRVWAARMGMELRDLRRPGVQHVEWFGSDVTVILRLGDAIVVAGPDAALDALRELSEPMLLDEPALLRALVGLDPVLIGAARLSYADSSMRSVAPGTPRTRRASTADVEDVLSRCTLAEQDESGLREMGVRCVAPDAAGRAAAAAGHEVWEDEMAHLGVAVAVDQRGRGLAQEVASSAAISALDSSPVLQWRSSVTNRASARTADRLGFREMGAQIAVDLRRR